MLSELAEPAAALPLAGNVQRQVFRLAARTVTDDYERPWPGDGRAPAFGLPPSVKKHLAEYAVIM